MSGSLSAATASTAADGPRPPVLLVALLVLVPLLLVPYAFRPYAANALALFLIYGLLAMSLNFIWGCAGIISFGQNAFFGVGAYAYGVIALNTAADGGGTGLAVAGGVAAAALLAAVFSYLMFYGRISDVYASIIVLVLSLVLYSFAVSTAGDEWVIGAARLGGFNGLFGQSSDGQNIGNFQIPSIALQLPWMEEPFKFGITRTRVSGFYLVLGACVAVYALARALLATRIGRVAYAIRENEARAATLGYDIRVYKSVMFTLAGAIAGLAGVLFASWGRFVNPEVFSITFASGVVVHTLLGGRLTLLGGFVGAIAIGYLTSYLGGLSPSVSPGVSAGWLATLAEIARRLVQQAPLLVQGGMLVVTVLLLRDGLVPPAARALAQWPRVAWLAVLPAALLLFASRVACRQADLCVF